MLTVLTQMPALISVNRSERFHIGRRALAATWTCHRRSAASSTMGGFTQDRLSAHAPSRTTSAPCAPVPCQFQLSGRNLDQAAEGYRQGRVASRRTLSPRRLHTNMSRPAERVVAFYNKRGTCEQWIKEGKGAIK